MRSCCARCLEFKGRCKAGMIVPLWSSTVQWGQRDGKNPCSKHIHSAEYAKCWEGNKRVFARDGRWVAGFGVCCQETLTHFRDATFQGCHISVKLCRTGGTWYEESSGKYVPRGGHSMRRDPGGDHRMGKSASGAQWRELGKVLHGETGAVGRASKAEVGILDLLLFFFCPTVACGVRLNPGPWQWKCRVLTTGPQGNFLDLIVIGEF